MPTVYNNSPYFDDFDPTKKFYRILFRPGRAVQARELTQLQTTLQNQIEIFGKNTHMAFILRFKKPQTSMLSKV